MSHVERPWFKFYPEKVPKSIEYPRKTLHQVLRETAKRLPDKAALIYFGKKVTFRELDELSDRFAAALADMGVGKGDKVAIMLPNCPQFVIAYYGALKAGAINVPLNPLYTPREVEYAVNNSEAKVIVVLDQTYNKVKEVKDRTRLEHVIYTSVVDFMPPLIKFLARVFKGLKPLKIPEATSFLELLGKYPPKPPEVDVKPDDLAMLLYTGGTTGVPKGVMLTHFNLLSNAVQTCTVGFIEEDSIALGVLPFFHSYGLTTVLNSSIYKGVTAVILPRFSPEDVFKAIKKYKPTHFPGVPTMYIALLNHPALSKYREHMRSIRFCISGAAPLPLEIAKKWREVTGGMIVEGYGLSEASPVTHVNPLDDIKKVKFGSIGVPVPDTDAKIVDLETGEKELPPGEVGELVVKGPQVGLGYWKMPEETEETFREGWLYTGDIAKMDEDGYFYIVDRKKDMINVGGLKAWPREIEEVLYQHPAVKLAAVVGVPDEFYGEVPKAFIVLRDEYKGKVKPGEIIDFCKERLAKYKVPKHIEFRDELPTTLVGKVLRRVLKEEELKKRES